MERQTRRDLEILAELERVEPLTQRALAQRLGIALGLANLYLKRLIRKGYVKVTTIPPNRIRYLLTPRGVAQKTRLTYEYMEYSLKLYRETRLVLNQGLLAFAKDGRRRAVLYGTGEAAELAYLTLRELGFELVMVVDADADNRTFLGLPVREIADIPPQSFDLLILASFDVPDKLVPRLVSQGIPREKIVPLRRKAA